MIVKGLIVNNGRFLLGRRLNKIGIGTGRWLWDLPGGHVKKGEELLEALVREIYEELNLKVCVGEFAYEGLIEYPGHEDVFYVYWIKHVSGELKLSEHNKVEWVHPESFDEYNIYPPWKKCLTSVTHTTHEHTSM